VAAIVRADQGRLAVWTYAGPKAEAYENCTAPVAMIEGPLGGGKSTASAHRCLRIATWQHPSPVDGIRKARIVCVAPTYRRAWDQVIPTFFEVYPRDGDGVLWRAARGDPADYTWDTKVRLKVGGPWWRVHLEVLFRAVSEGQTIEDFFRGFQFTAMWLPEADTNKDLDSILSLGASRAGRYPLPPDRPPEAPDAYVGVFGDSNAPVIGTPFFRRFHEYKMPDGGKAPRSDRLIKQPSGFSPHAENLQNLNRIRKNFYAYQMQQLSKYDIRRLLMNQPGFSREGEPVHFNFDPDTHLVDNLTVDPFGMVIISIDAGSGTLKPAAVFWQRSGRQWRALAEIYLPDGIQMGTQDFCIEVRRTLARRFHEIRRPTALIAIDPAALSPQAASQYTTAQEIQHHTQIEAIPAPRNDRSSRFGALDRLFTASVGPGEPAMVIDRGECPGLVGGLAGGYHYRRIGQILSPQPVKNSYSHVCEAAEYGPLTLDGMDPREGSFIRPDDADGYAQAVGLYEDGRFEAAQTWRPARSSDGGPW
jgi:hypothetical protein